MINSFLPKNDSISNYAAKKAFKILKMIFVYQEVQMKDNIIPGCRFADSIHNRTKYGEYKISYFKDNFKLVTINGLKAANVTKRIEILMNLDLKCNLFGIK